MPVCEAERTRIVPAAKAALFVRRGVSKREKGRKAREGVLNECGMHETVALASLLNFDKPDDVRGGEETFLGRVGKSSVRVIGAREEGSVKL